MRAAPVLFSAALLLAGTAAARDPMSPPTSAPARLPGTAGAVGAPAEAAAPPVAVHQLMTVDGQRWVVHQGRRRAVGEMLGTARIEAIEDQAVLLRQGGRQWRVPLFAGVAKRPVAETSAPAVAEAASAPHRPPATSVATSRREGAPRGDFR